MRLIQKDPTTARSGLRCHSAVLMPQVEASLSHLLSLHTYILFLILVAHLVILMEE